MTNRLFEDDATQPRTANRSRIRILLWLLVLLLLITIGTLVTIVTVQPGVVGLIPAVDLRQTNIAVQTTMEALEATSLHHQARDVDLRNTQAALNNFASLLLQTETQQAINNSSTRTAVAIANAQQATQVAVDFANTQAALHQASTEIQLQFEATQTALSSSLATIEANRMPENTIILNGDFVPGIETAASNQLLPSPAWAVSDRGILVAQVNNATALTRQNLFSPTYTLNMRIVPTNTPAHYDVLFGVVENQTGYTLRLYHDGMRVTSAALFPISSQDLTSVEGLTVNENAALNTARGLSIAANELSVVLSIDGAQVGATVNGVSLFTVQTPSTLATGAVGVQLPSGAQLLLLQIVPRS